MWIVITHKQKLFWKCETTLCESQTQFNMSCRWKYTWSHTTVLSQVGGGGIRSIGSILVGKYMFVRYLYEVCAGILALRGPVLKHGTIDSCTAIQYTGIKLLIDCRIHVLCHRLFSWSFWCYIAICLNNFMRSLCTLRCKSECRQTFSATASLLKWSCQSPHKHASC